MTAYCPRCDADGEPERADRGLVYYRCTKCGTSFATNRDADGDPIPPDRVSRRPARSETPRKVLAAV